MILTGLFTGFLAMVAFAILIEKMWLPARKLVFKHHLISDVAFTAVTLFLFPVIGIATLLTALSFMILFSIYLQIRRRRYGY
jgi:hypothetical protein